MLAGALAAGIVLAACGDDDDDGESNQSFSGEPVTIFVQAPIETEVSNNPDVPAAAKAAARAINEDGGLNGSEVVIEECNDSDANAELDCVRRAESEGAAAFVGSSFVFNPEAGGAVLEQAKIPSIASLAIQQVEFANPINFPIYTASFGLLACPQQTAEVAGVTDVASIGADLPVQKELLGVIEAGTNISDLNYAATVAVPLSQTDFSGPAQEVADSGANGLISVLQPTALPAFLSASQAVGLDLSAMCSVPCCFTHPTLEEAGTDTMYLSNGLPPTTEQSAEEYPLVEQYLDEMKAEEDAGNENASPSEQNAEGNAFNAWLGMQVLKQAAEQVQGPITSTKLLQVLNGLQPDLGNVTPPIDFGEPVAAPGFERMFNPVVNLYQWDPDNEEFVATDATPVNVLEVFAAIQAASGA